MDLGRTKVRANWALAWDDGSHINIYIFEVNIVEM